MTPTRIYLVRHGETAWNAAGRCQGRAHSDFTDRGRAQLEALAAALAGTEFDAAYSSPLERAVRTAERLLAGRGLRAATVPELAEFSYGTLQGTRFDEWPRDVHSAWRDAPWSVAFPGGESLAMVRDRMLPVLHTIVAAHAGETMLISAHGHVNRLILLDALERPLTDFWSIRQTNGSVTLIEGFAGATA